MVFANPKKSLARNKNIGREMSLTRTTKRSSIAVELLSVPYKYKL